MAAILMLGDVPVAEWCGAGNPPWFVPFSAVECRWGFNAAWPAAKPHETVCFSYAAGCIKYRISIPYGTPCYVYKNIWKPTGILPDAPAGYYVILPFELPYLWPPHSSLGATTSSVATLTDGAPVALTWTGVARVVYAPTEIEALKEKDTSA